MPEGVFWGVGVGPGEAELMTVKALRVLQSVPVVAAPRSGGACTALSIAQQMADLNGKEILYLDLPMTRDREARDSAHRRAAEAVCAHLAAGRDVAMLSLGDVSLYSSFGYLRTLVQAAGYTCRAVSGVPGFCAAAAALGRDLCADGETLTICPGRIEAAALDAPGGKVLLKAGRALPSLRQTLAGHGLAEQAALAVRVGMPGESLYPSLSSAPETDDYFSIILI